MESGRLKRIFLETDILAWVPRRKSWRWHGEYWKHQFMHNLSLYVDAGVDLSRTIRFCAKIVPRDVRDSAMKIAEAIEEGRSLADSIRMCIPGMLPMPLFSIVEIGEKSGGLTYALKIVDEELVDRMRRRNTALAVLIYPMMVFLVAAGIITFLLVKVIPTFAEIFHDLGAVLPPTTQTLIHLGGFIRSNVVLLGLFLLGILIVLSLFFSLSRRSAFLGKFLLRVPYLGTIVYHQSNQSFSRLLSVLLKVGTPISDALLLCESDALWACYKKSIACVREDVSEGKTFSEAMSAQRIFSPTFRWLVAVGEQNGDMIVTLESIGEYERACVQDNASVMFTFFEPTLLLCTSFVIGFIVVSMWLPVLKISELI